MILNLIPGQFEGLDFQDNHALIPLKLFMPLCARQMKKSHSMAPQVKITCTFASKTGRKTLGGYLLMRWTVHATRKSSVRLLRVLREDV
jgi:hypothetical protein